MILDFDSTIILILFFLYLISMVILKVKLKKSNNYILFFTLMFIYLSEVLNYTQFPIYLSSKMASVIGQNVFRDMNLIPIIGLTKEDIMTSLLNLIMAVPYGFLISFLKKQTTRTIIIRGLLFGLIIELIQFIMAIIAGFTMRYVDINDVIFNFIGVIVGYLLYRVTIITMKRVIKKFSIKCNSLLEYMLK